MHTRERLMGIEPRDKGLLVYSLRMRDEVVNMSKALESIPDVKPNKQMIDIAEKIIEQLEGPFEPEEFRDRYEEALRELIARKEKGEKPTVTAPPPEPSNVIDLMEALKKSLSAKAKSAPPRGTASLATKQQKKRAR
jgi:DNA end-binding protein Ku